MTGRRLGKAPPVSCVFCAIVRGETPASVVFEDERIVAFMDIRPVRPGQTLVIPRDHVDHFCDLPDDLASEVFMFGHRLSRAMRDALAPERVGMVVHGFGVRHAHLIVLPMEHPWDVTSARASYVEDGRAKFRPEEVDLAPRRELDEAAELLREALEEVPEPAGRDPRRVE